MHKRDARVSKAFHYGSIVMLLAACSGSGDSPGSVDAGGPSGGMTPDAGPVGLAPDAQDDRYPAQLGAVLHVPAATGILANDVLAGGALTVPRLAPDTSATVAGGTLLLRADGSFDYTPPAGFSGEDQWSYTLANAAGKDSATVAVIVAEAPSAVADAYTTPAGVVLTIPGAAGLLANDNLGYPDASLTSFGGGDLGGSVTAHAAGETASLAGGGSLVVRADGSLVFTPGAGATAGLSFSYRITSSAGTAEATVHIAEPTPPAAVDDVYRAASTVRLSRPAPGVLANDSLGAPHGVLTAFGGGTLGGGVEDHLPGTTVTVAAGVLTVRADGSFDFTGAPGFSGDFSFDYRLMNGGGASDASVTIGVVLGPVAVDDSFTVLAGTALAGDLLANDMSGFPPSVRSFGGGSLGGSVDAHLAGDSVSVGSGMLTVQTDGTFDFVADAGFSGLFTFSYRVANLHDSDTATVSVAVEQAPLAAADTYYGQPGVSLTVAAADGPLDNDTLGFPKAELVGWTLGGDHLPGETVTVDGGTLRVNADGSFALEATTFHARLTFDYRLRNPRGTSAATVTIDASGAPVAVADAFDTEPGHPLVNNLLANDALGAPPATLTSFGGGNLGGSVTDRPAGTVVSPLPGHDDGSLAVASDGSVMFVAASDQTADFSFSYRVTNSGGSSDALVTFRVRAPVTASSAGGGVLVAGQAGAVTLHFGGAPAPSITVTGGTVPAWLTVTDNHDGTVTIAGTPPVGSGGTYAFEATATNGVSSVVQQITITINEAPVVTSATSSTGFAVGAGGSFQMTASGFPAAISFINAGAALPLGLTLSADGLLSGTPAPGTGGLYTLTIRVDNGVEPAAVLVFVLTVTEAPTFTSSPRATFKEGAAGTTFQLAASGFPSTFTFSSVGAPLPPGLRLSTAGTLSGTPAASTQGVYALTFKVDNGVAPPATQSFTLTITAATTSGPTGITSEDHTELQVGVAGSFQITADGAADVIFNNVGAALPAGLTLDPNGLLSGTPQSGAGGVYTLTIQGVGGGRTVEQSFTLIIEEAPAITSADHATFIAGEAGSFQLTASGYPQNVVFTNTGDALPAGLTLSASGLLSGTPESPGVYNLMFQSGNGVGAGGGQSFTLTITERPVITSAASAAFSVGEAGSFTVTATGSPTPSLAVGGAALPSGLTFTDNGDGTATVAGTPAAGTGGSYALTFTATNSEGSSLEQTFTLIVNQAPVITSAAGATFTAGSAGSFTVTAGGFPRPAITLGGTLPAGVTFTDNGNGSGTLAGTPAANTGGTYALTFTAGGSAPQSFTLTVNQTPVITSTNATTFTAGSAGGFTVTASGFPSPAIARGGVALPAGVTFTDNGDGTGTLGGTPGAGTGGTYAITFTAGNGSPQAFTLTVNQAPAVTSASAASLTVGSAGSFTVTTTGFPKPSIALGGAALPSGVTFTDNGNGTGTLAGTPAAATGGSYAITFKATNTVGSTSAQSFTLTVNQAPAITSAASATLTVGTAGSFTVTTSGTPSPAIARGGVALPGGVTFTDNGNGTGTLAGTPAAGSGGTYAISFTATNSAGSSAAQSFTLTVNQAPAVTSANSKAFTVGTAGTFTVTTSGFPSPAIVRGGVALPAGLTFTDNGNGTGTLAGTPASGSGGTYAISFTATNSVGSSAAQSFTLSVNQAPAITSGNSKTLTAGTAGSFTVTTSGFPKPTIARGGVALPGGVTFTDNGDGTGTLSGTATANTGGTYALTFTATNSAGSSAAQSFTLTVNQAPAVTSANSKGFNVGAAGSFTVTTSGFPSPAIVRGGVALPAGLTFTDNGNGTGTLAGTPATGTGGSYAITFTATNSVGSSAAQSFTLSVGQAPTISSAASASFTVGSAGSFTVTTTGTPQPTIARGGVALPGGVTFTDNGNGTGTLAGTPVAGSGASYAISFTATNAVGSSAAQAFTLTVNQAPAVTSANSKAFTVGTAGTFTVTTTGFPKPAIARGGVALPTGVTFTDNGNGTGTLAGTPAAATGGTYAITFTATNTAGSSAAQSFTVTVNQAPAVTSGTSKAFTVGTAGTFAITTTGFPSPAIARGGVALPSGLTFTDNGNGTGTLAGTPAANTGGSYAITFTATNSVGSSAAQAFTVTVNQGPTVTSAASATFTVGGVNSFIVTTAGFPKPALARGGVALPSGVTFTDNGNGTGTLAGTPAAGSGGSYAITFTATNSVGSSAAQAFTLTVNQAPAVTSAASATFTAGSAGTFTVTTTGTPKPTIARGGVALPAGLSFTDNGNGTGTLAGTPAAATGGTYAITFTATNSVGSSAAQAFTLTVNQAPTVTSAASATFTVGTAGTFSVTTTGTPKPTIARGGATLPTGVTFTDNGNGTGTLAGTPAAATGGSYAILFTATNAAGSSTAQAFTLTVNQAPTVASAASATFTVGTAGTFAVTTTGTPKPTIARGGVALPAGVTFTDNGNGTGTLAGTPGAGTGGTYAISFTATNTAGSSAAQTFTLTVNQAPTVTSAASATFTIGTAGSFAVTTAGVPKPTLARGGVALPGGVTFTDNGNGTGTLAGTPAAGTGGTYAITFTATNTVGASAAQAFTLTVNQAPVVTSANNKTFTAGTAGTFTVTTSGTPKPTIAIGGAALPSGLTFTDNGDGTGTLAGTPAAASGGSRVITFKATNSVGSSATQSFTVTVNQLPAITTGNSNIFIAGTAGNFTVTTTGFPTPTIARGGVALPSGISFTDNGNGTASLGGTAALGTGGTYAISFTATNAAGSSPAQSFTITVKQAPTFTSASAATFTVGTAGSFTVTTAGSPVSTIFRAGVLPGGVTFTDNGNGTATIAGTPTAGTGGSYPVTLTASNGLAPAGSQSFTLNVNQAPAVTSANNSGFVVGTAGSFTVTTTGFPKPTLARGGVALPSGLTFVDNGNGTGTLSGTPASGTGGSYAITFTATNSLGSSAAQSFTLSVTQAPAVTSANTATFTVGNTGSFTVTTVGTPVPTVARGGASLPAGLTFTANANGTGTLAGTPAAGTGGSYAITFTATNSLGSFAAQTFTLVVKQAPVITSANATTFVASASNSFTVTASGFPAPAIARGGVALPSGLTFTSNGDGTATLSGTPTSGGTYAFTFTATNSAGSSAAQSFTLTVTAGVPPVAAANPAGGIPGTSSPGSTPYHIAMNGSIASGASPLLMANDTLGTPTAAVTSFGPATGLETTVASGGNGATTGGGTVRVLADGHFSYTPASATFTGLDTFFYRISSAAGGSVAMVTVAVGVRPGATNENFSATQGNMIGNTSIDSAVGTPYTVLTNDTGDQKFASLASVSTGSATVNADGTFVFNPAPGFEGTATITYNVNNGFGAAQGVVSITVAGMIWFIDANAASGDGRQATPFPSGVELNASAAVQAGDNIFMKSGNYAFGLTLLANQKLIGEGASASLESLTGLTPNPRSPALPATGSSVAVNLFGPLKLGSNNTLRGFIAGGLVSGSSFGTLTTANDVSIITFGPAIKLTNGVLAGSVTKVQGSGEGIVPDHLFALTGVTGSWNIGSTNLNGMGQGMAGLLLDNVDANLTFGKTLIDLSNLPEFANCIGMVIMNGSDGTFTFAKDSHIARGNGTASLPLFKLSSSNAVVTFHGDIVSGNGTGSLIDINGHSAGNITFDTGSLVTHGNLGPGIGVSNVTGGVITFNPVNFILDTDTQPAVSLLNNTGGTMRFVSGNLGILTSSGNGFYAVNGGTVTVTGTQNTIDTIGGTALFMQGVTIGPDGLTFLHISAGTTTNTAGNGIILRGTGENAGLTVTGIGTTPGSGGTIQHKTGPNSEVEGSGIYLQATINPSFANLRLHDFSNYAIRALDVSGFTLKNSVIDGIDGDSSHVFDNEGGIAFNQVYGTVSILDTSIRGGSSTNIFVFNFEDTLTFTMDRCTIGDVQDDPNLVKNGFTAVAFEGGEHAQIKATVTHSTFTGAGTALFSADASESSSVDLVFRDNQLSNSHVSFNPSFAVYGVRVESRSAGTVTYDISHNTISCPTVGTLHTFSTAIAAESNGGSSMAGTINANTIGVAGVANSGCPRGITVDAKGFGQLTTAVTNNRVSQYVQVGIEGGAVSNGLLNATITGNRIAATPGEVVSGFSFENVDSALNLALGNASTASVSGSPTGSLQNEVVDNNFDVVFAAVNGATHVSKAGSQATTLAGVVADDNVGSPGVETTVDNGGSLTLVTTMPATPPPVAP